MATLQFSEGKKLAREIFLETMAAIDVRRAMLAKIERRGDTLRARSLAVSVVRPPRVCAFGKAAHRMASMCHKILDGKVEAGVVVAPTTPARKLERFRYFVGGHPYPNAGSLKGAAAALELVSRGRPDSLVIFLVSGGGSALFEKPLDAAISLANLIEFNRILVTCGLPIEQMNALRKHLSAVKGGRLAVAAHLARQLTIFISDVPESLPSMVASGPTMPDESTVEQCYSIAAQHDLAAQFPAAIRKHFVERTLRETPKPGDRRFAYSRYFCLLSNRDAVEAAKTAAEHLGLVCEIASENLDADYRLAAPAHLARLDRLAARHPGRPVAIVAGGEVISPVTGPGTGGRNQAYTLYAAQLIAGRKRVVLSAGTDGRDGNSPAAGAVADGDTVSRGRAHGLDPEQHLAASDSYAFFHALDDTLETGPTDNNVRDVRVWLDFETGNSKLET